MYVWIYTKSIYIYIGVYLYNARDQKVQGREATLVGENLSTKKPSTPAWSPFPRRCSKFKVSGLWIKRLLLGGDFFEVRTKQWRTNLTGDWVFFLKENNAWRVFMLVWLLNKMSRTRRNWCLKKGSRFWWILDTSTTQFLWNTNSK